MSLDFIYNVYFPFLAFAAGAAIGSFLNVVIYRVPLGISVNKPKRSFCPNCNTQIPALLNLPLITWLMLRGKCKWCKKSISVRYFLVELITAIIFFAIYKLFITSLGFAGVLALWVLASLLISATFIDFDHMIIPDSITIGGTVVGVLFSIWVPMLHQKETWLGGLTSSLMGAALGFFLLWGVVLLGKLIFGQIKHSFEKPVDFEISQPGGEEEAIIIKLGEHEYEWQDVFHRKSDRMDMEITELAFNDKKQKLDSGTMKIVGDGFVVDGEKTELSEGLKKVSGKTTRAVVPREAMGFGDVKFIAMIGAFQGWQAVLITIMAACCIGAVIGTIQKYFSKNSQIPFGPYLALGSFIVLFTGMAVWDWYTGMLNWK